MPWTATYGADGAEVRYSGVTTGADILEAKGEFFARRFPDRSRFLLCDFTLVERFDVSTAEVDQIVEQDRAVAAENPELAEVVIAPTPIQYGLARMWQIRIAGVRERTAVVRTRTEAHEWLGHHGINVPSSTEQSPQFSASRPQIDSPPAH